MSSEEDEDEVIQAANFGEATDEGLQEFIEAHYATQERELGQIDKALDAVETADSPEAAVAALARATVGINALYSGTSSVAPLEIISPRVNLEWRSQLVSPSFHLHPRAEEMERKRNERIEKYLKVANDLVQKYKADQYQLSLGFPLLVSVTLTWNVRHEPDLSSDLRASKG
jgi:hypothetical protein